MPRRPMTGSLTCWNEWGLTEETDSSVTAAKKEKMRLLAKV